MEKGSEILKKVEGKTVKEKNSVFAKIMKRNEMPVLIATILLCVVFTIFSSSFLSAYNIFNVTRTAALYMFVALSQTMVMIVGGMNVSLGYIGALSVVTCGYCMQELHMNSFVTIVLALLVGVICGLINGLIIIKLHINSFVATLATQFIFKGLVTGISEGYPYTEINKGFTFVGRNKFLGLPLMLYLAVAALVVVWYIFRYTVLGRKLLATGGNEKAAKMAAVNTENMMLIANILSGLFAAIAGICAVSMNGAAQPTTGSDWMIYSFAVSVIGGTALAGGVICPIGIVIAGIMIVIIKNGLIMLNANVYYEQTYLGLILLVAVSLASLSALFQELKRRRAFAREHTIEKK